MWPFSRIRKLESDLDESKKAIQELKVENSELKDINRSMADELRDLKKELAEILTQAKNTGNFKRFDPKNYIDSGKLDTVEGIEEFLGIREPEKKNNGNDSSQV